MDNRGCEEGKGHDQRQNWAALRRPQRQRAPAPAVGRAKQGFRAREALQTAPTMGTARAAPVTHEGRSGGTSGSWVGFAEHPTPTPPSHPPSAPTTGQPGRRARRRPPGQNPSTGRAGSTDRDAHAQRQAPQGERADRPGPGSIRNQAATAAAGTAVEMARSPRRTGEESGGSRRRAGARPWPKWAQATALDPQDAAAHDPSFTASTLGPPRPAPEPAVGQRRVVRSLRRPGVDQPPTRGAQGTSARRRAPARNGLKPRSGCALPRV